MNVRMTIVGMEQTLNADNKSIVDTFELLPSEEELDYDKDVLLATIMRKAGTFEPLYTNPEYFYWDVSMWWKKWRRNFTKQAEALMIEYKPLENYRRNEIAHSDTVDNGTLNQETSGREVMDDDTTSKRQLEHTWSDEADGTQANTEVVDSKTTGTHANTEVVDGEVNVTKAGTETTDGEVNVTGKVTEAVEEDTTNSKTTSGTEQKTNNGGYTTNNTVAGFNSASLEPKSGESNTHNDTDNTTTSGTESGKGSLNRTTTTQNNEKTEEDKTVTTSGTEKTTEDRTTTNNGSESGTENRTTTNNGTTHEERSGTGKDVETATGTDDRTTTNNGSLDQTTSNDRDWDHTSEIWGNIGVTTSQTMLKEELEIRKWNLYDFMSDKFVDECCVRVY